MEIFGFNALTLTVLFLFIFLIISVIVDLIDDIRSKENVKDSSSLQLEE